MQRTTVSRSRRDFLGQGAAAVAAAGVGALNAPLVHAGGADDSLRIKIGVIGCGGRGGGAALDALGAQYQSVYPQKGIHTEYATPGAKVEGTNIEVVALADLFSDRLDLCRANLKQIGVEVPEENCFLGFDAYKDLLALSEVNYVILATPPHFRPAHLMAAVEAGKNVFLEKPAAVDAPGVRQVIETGRIAEEKGLGIAAGTQRRHQTDYLETVQRLRDGAIGEFTYGKCYWNGDQIWVVDRESGWSDMEWQIRNWNHFIWLSGDHLVEQHVHNLDVMNWVIGSPPIRAVAAMGGRQVRTGEVYGNVNDHFAVEYEYPNGVTVFSQCRQINGCHKMVGEQIYGTRGHSNCQNRIYARNEKPWRYRKRVRSSYRAEHANLIASIRAGTPINEARAIAESTMTGILGREAAYSGQPISWEEALQWETRLGPTQYAMADYPVSPVRMPGTHRAG